MNSGATVQPTEELGETKQEGYSIGQKNLEKSNCKQRADSKRDSGLQITAEYINPTCTHSEGTQQLCFVEPDLTLDLEI
jgi:hypothetical protein